MVKRKTPASQLAAVAAYDQRRRDAGLMRVSVWLSPSTVKHLSDLQRSTDESRDYLVNLALLKLVVVKR